MVTKIIKEWEITVSITRTFTYPLEDNENKDDFCTWAQSQTGKQFLQNDFIRHLNCYSYPRNGDMSIEDIELKETEVKSTDTDPRV